MSRNSTVTSDTRAPRLAHNAGWVLLGQGSSFVLQVGYFVLLARMLGVEEYGVFAGASALVSLVIPFGNLGSGMLFMRHVTADPKQFSRYWGNIIFSTGCAGSLLIAILWLIAPLILHGHTRKLVLLLALANCLLGQLVHSIIQVFQSFENLRIAAFVNTSTNALRFAAVAVLKLKMERTTAEEWAAVALGVSCVVAALCVALVIWQYGRPKWSPPLILESVTEGIWYSAAGSTASIYNDLDKTILGHLGMNVANGIYTTAYRIVDVATLPVTSVEWAAVPRLFREASDGAERVMHAAIQILKSTLLLGAGASVGLLVLAPLVPKILGPGFEQAALALRWLSLLPFLRTIHQITGAALTATGKQRFRTISQFVVAAINVLLNFIWIPRYGWVGAAWASLVSDLALGLINWTGLWLVGRQSQLRTLNA